MSASKERFYSHNTLTVLLIAMTGRKVIVETKNESTITGKLLESDGYGNLWLSNSKLTSVSGKKCHFDELHVKASSVRYVHLPDDVDMLKAINTELKKKPTQRTAQMPPKYKKT